MTTLTGSRYVVPYATAFDSTGIVSPGALLNFYVSGSSTPQNTYSNPGLTILNSNPVQANGAGLFPNIFLTNAAYKVVLTDTNGDEIWTADPVYGIGIESASEGWNFSTTTLLLAAFGGGVSLADGTQAVTLGRTAVGDLGGGLFYYKASDTTTADNGGTIRVDGANRRWYYISVNDCIAPELFGANANGTFDCTTTLNAAHVWTIANHQTLLLSAGKYLITGTLNSTAGTGIVTGSNNGLTIIGQGSSLSIILYLASSNNTGIAWDLSGSSRGVFRGFSVLGGQTAANNSPQATVLLGAVNNASAFLFCGEHIFEDVEFDNQQGDYTVVNNGAEQVDFHNCIVVSKGTNGTAVPFLFTASGSTPIVSSALVTTYSPVQSMTDVHWYGSAASVITSCPYAVLFHFSAAGAVANIFFDDYFQFSHAAGTVKVFADDAAGMALTAMTNIGGRRIILENSSSNASITLASLSTASTDGLILEGALFSPVTISADQVTISGAATRIDVSWNPSGAGFGWSGNFIVNNAANVPGGVSIKAPVVNAKLLSAGAGGSYFLQGSDTTTIH